MKIKKANRLSTLTLCLAGALGGFACSSDDVSETTNDSIFTLSGTINNQAELTNLENMSVSMLLTAPFEYEDSWADEEAASFDVRAITKAISDMPEGEFAFTLEQLPSDDFGYKLGIDEVDEELQEVLGINVPTGASSFHVYNAMMIAHDTDFDIDRCFKHAFETGFMGPSSINADCTEAAFETRLHGAVENHALLIVKFDVSEELHIVDMGPPSREAEEAYERSTQDYERCQQEALDSIVTARTEDPFEAAAEAGQNISFIEIDGVELTSDEYDLYLESCEYPDDDALYYSQFRDPMTVDYELTLTDASINEWLAPLVEMIDIF